MRAKYLGIKKTERLTVHNFNYESDEWLIMGGEYYIHCIAGFPEAEFFAIMDGDSIATVPAVFFELTDNTVPDNWILHILDDNYRGKFLLGPDVIVGNIDRYDDFVNTEFTDEIWDYLESLGKDGETIMPD